MSQYQMETEEDMISYLDIEYGHGVSAVYTNNGTDSTIRIILNNEYVEQEEGIGVEARARNVFLVFASHVCTR